MKIFITGSNGLLGQKLIKKIQTNTPEAAIFVVSKGVNKAPRTRFVLNIKLKHVRV
jgi:NAD dependent epimerase/dehydratase family enzyme